MNIAALIFNDDDAPVVQRIAALHESRELVSEFAAITADIVLLCKSHVPILTPKFKAFFSAIIRHEVTQTTSEVRGVVAAAIIKIGEDALSELLASLAHDGMHILDSLAKEIKKGSVV